MKLQDFDFRVWNTACKKYIDDVGLISNIMCDLIHSATDIIEDFEIELWTGGFMIKMAKRFMKGISLKLKVHTIAFWQKLAFIKKGLFILRVKVEIT